MHTPPPLTSPPLITPPPYQARTENPHEANLFYVPLLVFPLSDNAGDPYEITRRGLVHIEREFPQFWGRNEGKDHFVW